MSGFFDPDHTSDLRFRNCGKMPQLLIRLGCGCENVLPDGDLNQFFGWRIEEAGESGRSNAGRVLREFALQRPAVKTEPLCRKRNVASAVGEDALNVFPLHPREAGNSCRLVRIGSRGGRRLIYCNDLIGVDRLAQVMIRASADRLYCSGDASPAREHNDEYGCVEDSQFPDDIESAFTPQPQIYDRQVRRVFSRQHQCLRSRARKQGLPPARIEGAAQPRAEQLIVIDNECREPLCSGAMGQAATPGWPSCLDPQRNRKQGFRASFQRTRERERCQGPSPSVAPWS